MTPRTTVKKTTAKTESGIRYFEGLGKRKTAVARVRVTHEKGPLLINGKNYSGYFTVKRHVEAVTKPFETIGMSGEFSMVAKVSGSGPNAQAEAVRHGIARALVKFNEEFKKKLRRAELLTRDPRMVERKKYGLKKARRAPQWKKR